MIHLKAICLLQTVRNKTNRYYAAPGSQSEVGELELPESIGLISICGECVATYLHILTCEASYQLWHHPGAPGVLQACSGPASAEITNNNHSPVKHKFLPSLKALSLLHTDILLKSHSKPQP